MGRTSYIRSLKKDELICLCKSFALSVSDDDTVDDLRRIASKFVKENNVSESSFPTIVGSHVELLREISQTSSPQSQNVLSLQVPSAKSSSASQADETSKVLSKVVEVLDKLVLSSIGRNSPDTDKTEITRFTRECSNKKICFSGAPEENVLRFIEQVEYVKTLVNVSDESVVKALPEVLRAKALITFRAFPDRFASWSLTRDTLLSFYHEPTSELRLTADLLTRTQVSGEDIVSYVSVMTLMNSRLNCSKPESELLQIVLLNLHPEYRRELKHFHPSSMKEVLEYGLRWESEKKRDASHKPPSEELLKHPESGFKPFLPISSRKERDNSHLCSSSSQSQKIEPLYCLRCLQHGHLATSCKNERRPYCFRCFKLDNYANECDCTSKNQHRSPKFTDKFQSKNSKN